MKDISKDMKMALSGKPLTFSVPNVSVELCLYVLVKYSQLNYV